MKKLKKILIRGCLVLLVLLIAYTVFNQFDAQPEPTRFTRANIPQASDRPDNGYWLLWAMQEPPEVDITGQEIIDRYKKLLVPKKDRGSEYETFLKRYKELKFFEPFLEKLTDNYAYTEGRMVSETLLAKPQAFDFLAPELQILIERMQLLIDRPVFQEWVTYQLDSPLPTILVFLRASRLYAMRAIRDALKGDWEKSINQLLDQVNFGKRMVAGSKQLVLNLIGKAVIRESLMAITDLMNQRSCPTPVFLLVQRRLPEIRYEEYGARSAIVYEFLQVLEMSLGGPWQEESSSMNFLGRLFFHKNRTWNLAQRRMLYFVEHDETPPYQWSPDKLVDIEALLGSFWWLQNPVGKGLLVPSTFFDRSVRTISSKSHLTKAIYDMVRIAAFLHQQYDGSQKVPEMLAAYQDGPKLDLCSGETYRWNEAKQLLYSIGTDRVDNQGDTKNYQSFDNSDYALPVILFVR